MNENKSWQKIASTYKEGTKHIGRVTQILEYACYVELEKDVLAFFHRQDMAWVTTNLRPVNMVSCEDCIEVMVLELNEEKKSISVGMKQCTKNPWKGIVERYLEGKRVKGLVIKVMDYGCMVLIEEGIEGIVYVSEMDWTNKNIYPDHLLSVGDTIEVVVLDVNETGYRMSLGLKQCQPNPWEEFAQKYKINDSLIGKVDSFFQFGLFVKLEWNLSGFVATSDLPANAEGLKEGDELRLKLISIDIERERIGLSVMPSES
ncbi:S1 RNA-binding domain-containing protein [Marinifilum sp. RC60d5]|uniref:S1 RNA-binding domain-containing protein n=1 Tax=Marinifilum sp. RC60d5 TaxID=3458414 RepID=UPI0040360A6F